MMKDLILSLILLLLGGFTLFMRAHRSPYDYKKDLLVTTQDKASLSNALEKVLEHKKSAPLKNSQ